MLALAASAVGAVIVTVPVALQLLLSRTVNVNVPAERLLILEVVALLDQAYVYGKVPPLGADCALPVFPLLQPSLVETVAFANKAFGCVIVTEAVAEHPL